MSSTGESSREISTPRSPDTMWACPTSRHIRTARRVQAPDEVGDDARGVRLARGAGVHRREVLERQGDAERLRERDQPAQRALLRLERPAAVERLVPAHHRDVGRVVDDVLGARDLRVREQALQRAIVAGAAGAQLVGSVEHEAQVGRGEELAQRVRVGDGADVVAQDRGGRRVDLDPCEARCFEALEHRDGRPPVPGHVHPEPAAQLGAACGELSPDLGRGFGCGDPLGHPPEGRRAACAPCYVPVSGA